MLLIPKDADLFFKLHKALMAFVNQKLAILPGIKTAQEFGLLSPDDRYKVSQALFSNLQLIEEFIGENPARLPDDELAIVHSWRHFVTGKFYVFRELKKYTVFLSSEKHPVAYGVLAMTTPFEEIVGSYLPVWIETTLLPFKDQIIYEGTLRKYPISFGPGIRRSLNEEFKKAKDAHGIVTSLPMSEEAPKAKKPPAKPRVKVKPKGKDDAAAETIYDLVDRFCRTHLNDEYAVLCRRLAEKLARKRPSPLASGKPETWACGIVRTIGWVNFLDDRASKPHMKLTAIDKAFGVGESTGQGKSMLIRKTLKIRSFDPQWTLPSRQGKNPLTWMLSVNGMMMDIRHAPREVQEVAFARGLIPYIPADQDSAGK
ncbi:DUF6398 domain-containing protein [Fimbriiglobus ruber]|uniref:DUF6398 domain-containing protein n=1 Tax=Fimbriiglobus ruber TaxID=1908690 RepID=A0A225E7V2_9BACT|nr:DUF6398 domain-containing protein [Fimbriiglobus ruber]OWK44507.1 hypothetical protein FRUB_02439 [Fimbriiglobus ruber]